MVVARRAPPIDARGGLAGDKAPVLPEIFARPCAPPAMQAMDHRRRDAPRFEYEPGHGGGKRVAGANRPVDGRNVMERALTGSRIWTRI
jgi:hypothetical protein